MSTTYTRFRQDNTEGYTDAQLAELNRRYSRRVSTLNADDLQMENAALKSLLDNIAERIQAEYDTELSAAPATEDEWARSQGFV